MPITRAAERRNSRNNEKANPTNEQNNVTVPACRSPAVDSLYNESSLDSADSSYQSVTAKESSELVCLSSSESLTQQEDKKSLIEISEEDVDESSLGSAPCLKSDDLLISHELLGSTPLVTNSFSSTMIKTNQNNLVIDPNRWLPGQRNLFLTDIQSSFLEKVYQVTPYLDSDLKRKLSVKMNIHPEKVKMWFQNRRTKDRQFYRKQGKEPHWLARTNRTKQMQSSMRNIISDINFDFERFKYSSSLPPTFISGNGDSYQFHFPANCVSNELTVGGSMEKTVEHAAPPPPSTQHLAKSQNNLSNMVLVSSLQDLTNLINNQNPNCISQVFQNGELSGILPTVLPDNNSPRNQTSKSFSSHGDAQNDTKPPDNHLKSVQHTGLSVSLDDRSVNGMTACMTAYPCGPSEQESKVTSTENSENSFNSGSNPLCFQNSSYFTNQSRLGCQFYGATVPYQQPPFTYHSQSPYYAGHQPNYGGYFPYSDHAVTSVMQPYIPRINYSNYFPPHCKPYPYEVSPGYYNQLEYYDQSYQYNSLQSTLPRIESFLSPQYESCSHVSETGYASCSNQPPARSMSMHWNSTLPNSGVPDVSCNNDFNIEQIVGPLDLDANFSAESNLSGEVSNHSSEMMSESRNMSTSANFI